MARKKRTENTKVTKSGKVEKGKILYLVGTGYDCQQFYRPDGRKPVTTEKGAYDEIMVHGGSRIWDELCADFVRYTGIKTEDGEVLQVRLTVLSRTKMVTVHETIENEDDNGNDL